MTMRTRKLIGTFLTLIWITVYALIAMAVGGEFVVGRGMLPELAYYIIAGVAWLPVSMKIIRWMSKPDPV
jgi:hypothetical protein